MTLNNSHSIRHKSIFFFILFFNTHFFIIIINSRITQIFYQFFIIIKLLTYDENHHKPHFSHIFTIILSYLIITLSSSIYMSYFHF